MLTLLGGRLVQLSFFSQKAHIITCASSGFLGLQLANSIIFLSFLLLLIAPWLFVSFLQLLLCPDSLMLHSVKLPLLHVTQIVPQSKCPFVRALKSQFHLLLLLLFKPSLEQSFYRVQSFRNLLPNPTPFRASFLKGKPIACSHFYQELNIMFISPFNTGPRNNEHNYK